MPQMPKERRVILFGRYPVPGHTKTRLIPSLGALGAADLQRQLTEQTIATITKTNIASTQFAYTGGTGTQMRRWLKDAKIYLVPQPKGDLGYRMRMHIKIAFAQGAQEVVLVGTDIPGLKPQHLIEAFDALANHDLVFGPSNDGGYWLIGCRKDLDIFTDIPWSTPEVLAQTVSKADKLGLKTTQLPPLNDIDTVTDLESWEAYKLWQRPYLSVVIPTFNEAANIVPAIKRVTAQSIEIIVADGGSTDGTPEMARGAGAKVIQTMRGRARQQNEGALIASGFVLLFLHADTRLPDDFGRHIFELLMDPKIVLGAFQFKTDYSSKWMKVVETVANLRAKWLHMPYGDQALFMRKTAFARIGGFPEVPIAEDLLLVNALSALGNIGIAGYPAITSGRRWEKLGIVHTTTINFVIAIGCLLGIPPQRLAPLYMRGRNRYGKI